MKQKIEKPLVLMFNYDNWVLVRDEEKALSGKVEPYIKRDATLLKVGDILVADEHKLAFQVINPLIGKTMQSNFSRLSRLAIYCTCWLQDYA
ncbi:MAG: hypothetical protein LUH05_00650 [Candidatus Gastranaerophilales bacterium]|nr:hypothetical protein [Candidatus Gastranaerophilales bacterium]